jgi:L-2-hydroxyglutarate oxidase
LATAFALSERHGVSVVVLEAEGRLAAHQTGHNSGVIHAGLYYKPGSSKARLCAAGRESMYAFCREHDIPHRQCGKLVVATSPNELPRLNELEERGRANGLTDMVRIGPVEIREREPLAAGVAGLWIPATGIVNFGAVCEKYAEVICSRGGDLRLTARLTQCRREPHALVLETTGGVFRARHLINCAGLQCDRVARRCGVDPGVRIVPFRGEYYLMKPGRADMIHGLIYPVPDPVLPFLGAHFTRMIDGAVEIGPNAVLATKREGYRRRDVRLADLLDWAMFPGFWKMARRQWRVGLAEQYRSIFKTAFLKSARKLVPTLRDEDVRRGGAGVRAQAVDRFGNLLQDFHIVRGDRSIHVLNAPSPAATASLAIGQEIRRIAAEHFGIKTMQEAPA